MTDANVSGYPRRARVSVDAAKLWGGGVATGLVAALMAAAGVLICEGVLDIDLVRPALLLDTVGSFLGDYALTAFVLALVATGLAHALALATPRPSTFFGWLMALAIVCGAAAPFAIGSEISSQLATACINIALGVCVWSLLSAVMSRTVRLTA